GFKQDGFSRKDGTTETQDRRRLALRAARKPVPVAAMRLRQHASRQPAVAGRAVAQARARGRNRQGGLEMSTEKEILALEDRRCAAMTAGDLASLEKLLHDELLYTHSSGVMDTKASWLLSMKYGKTRYKSVKCSGSQVRIVVDGERGFQGPPRGRPPSDRRRPLHGRPRFSGPALCQLRAVGSRAWRNSFTDKRKCIEESRRGSRFHGRGYGGVQDAAADGQVSGT